MARIPLTRSHPEVDLPGSLISSDGTEHSVRNGMVLGRGKSCDVVLTDTKASRQHVRIHDQHGVVELEDLGSSNGTLLNGKPVTKRMLRDGDVVRIGTTELVYRSVTAAPAGAGGEEFGAGDDLFADEEDAPPPVTPARPAPPPSAPPPSSDRVPLEPPRPTSPVPPPSAAPPVVDRAPLEPLRPAPPAPRVDADPEPEPVVELRSAAKPAAAEEVLEFADDDVVLVKRAPPAASAGKSAASASTNPAGADRGGGVLQFHKVEDRGGLAAADLAQMSGPIRLLMVLLALAIAAGLFYVAMRLAS
ncbi:MAG: FHA domain-containing protein [Planctomycetes bacterium]|nr:FHA domain-containing protein [Planctomycetota bacterium]